MYSFLLIGQSNAAGRGFPNEVPELDNERLYMQRNGKWRPMYTPVNPDRRSSGVSLAESFAWHCSRYYNADIGIIPCADGGSRLDQWMPGEELFDHAVFHGKLAQRSSQIVGVLWHQGESDSKADLYLQYEEKCTHIFETLRKELSLEENVPFLIGELGSYLADWDGPEIGTYFPAVNKALAAMAEKNDYIGLVSAEGLTSNPDNMHFNAVSLRVLGERYFQKFISMSPLVSEEMQAKYQDTSSAIEHL